MPRLHYSTASGEHEFSLENDTVAGRSTAADLVIDDDTVSRRHARFSLTDGQLFIEDLGSGNGTVVNGVMIHQPTALTDGDEILLGKVEMVVRDALVARSSIVLEETAAEELRAVDSVVEWSGAALTPSVRLRHIAELASVLAEVTSEEAMFDCVVERLFGMFNQAERVCVILREPESGELKPRLARTRSGTAEEIPVSRSILSRVVGERKALVCVDSSADTRFSAATTVLQFGLRTFASIPMIAGAEVIGVLQVDSSGPTRAFTEDDVATLLAVAAQTALSLANRRMQQALLTHEIMNQDLALARRIQSHFLPQTAPAIPGYSFDWTYSPALGVGGDYFDFLSLSATEHAIVIADVSGKGISAALYMAKLGSEMRHHVFAGAKPGEILRKLNKALTRELEEGMFVTLLLMLLDTATGELKVASAGHQSPIVRRADGEVSLLRVPQNSPVGMQNYGGFEEESFRLGHRDVVVAYTDGVSEAMNEQKEIFTDARLLAAIEKAGGTAVTVKESIMADVEKHRAGAPPNDDLTLICFGPV